MTKSLDEYRQVVGDDVIGEIYARARSLQGKHVVHVNSTSQGGGVLDDMRKADPESLGAELLPFVIAVAMAGSVATFALQYWVPNK